MRSRSWRTPTVGSDDGLTPPLTPHHEQADPDLRELFERFRVIWSPGGAANLLGASRNRA
jgi:hypothetical protein